MMASNVTRIVVVSAAAAEMRTLVACKGEVLHLKCPKSRFIALQWASYGYSSEAPQNKCPSQSAYDTGECRDRPTYDTYNTHDTG
jgi:hypothetical protein